MRRLILGLAAFAFLGLVGAQSVHAHEPAADRNCSVCVLTRQSVRLTPAACPAPHLDLRAEPLPRLRLATAVAALGSLARARAPPSK